MKHRNSGPWQRARAALAVAAVPALALAAPAAGAAGEDALTLKWKDGLRIESADGKIQAKIGGRIQLDALAGNFDDRAETDLGVRDAAGVIFRRARINLEASFSDYFFKAEYDFAGGTGDTNFRDVYLGIKGLPCSSSLQLGHFKEPFSLDQLTSDNYVTFLERNLADNFTPARNTGLMWTSLPLEGRMTYALGGFRETGDFGDDYDDNETWNLTTRITGLPIANQDGSRLLHLGASYSHKFMDINERYRVRARPGIGSGDRFFDTTPGTPPAGFLQTDNVDLFGVEGAFVFGPASLQAEYIHSLVDGHAGLQSDVDFWGSYVEASVFVTPGDQRGYKREAGAFDRVKPKSPFSLSGGRGAVQLALRFDVIDLQDGNVSGGRGWTVGPAVNWYLTSNLRLIGNYVHGDREGDGTFNGGGVRFQVDY